MSQVKALLTLNMCMSYVLCMLLQREFCVGGHT